MYSLALSIAYRQFLHNPGYGTLTLSKSLNTHILKVYRTILCIFKRTEREGKKMVLSITQDLLFPTNLQPWRILYLVSIRTWSVLFASRLIMQDDDNRVSSSRSSTATERGNNGNFWYKSPGDQDMSLC